MTDQTDAEARDDDYELDPETVAAVVESLGVGDLLRHPGPSS